MKRLLFLFVLLSIFSCSDEATIIPIEPESNELNFSKMRVGQQSKFVKYNYDCEAETLNFLEDTLIVTVTEDENSNLFLTEHFSENSLSYDSTYLQTYPIVPQKDIVLITERWNSNLFFFYGNDTIFLNKEKDIDLVQNQCFLNIKNEDNPFVGEQIGFVANYNLEEVEYKNLKAVSCVPMIGFENSYIFYDEEKIYGSQSQSYFWYDSSMNGWKLLEEEL